MRNSIKMGTLKYSIKYKHTLEIDFEFSQPIPYIMFC